jgi:predicted acyl esterase
MKQGFAAPGAVTVATLLVLLGIGGCNRFGDAGPAAAQPRAQGERVPPEVWQAGLSEPRYTGVVSRIVYVAAEDGTQLSLTLHLPAGAPPDEKLPTLLQLTPYQAFLSTRTYTPLTGTQGPGADWRDFVLRGAAYVEADERGSTASSGCLDFGGSLDRSDARVFADWIRAQAWSNGIIVTDGVSHPGMGSVVAHAAVPGLTAALAHAPVVSYYQDEWLQGAKFEDQFNGPLYEVVELGPPFYLTPEAVLAQPTTCRGQTTLAFSAPEGTFTPFWDDRHLARHHAQALAAPVPILLTHGFVDLNVHPDHTQMYWDALPKDYPKHLIMGWWYHGWPDLSGHAFASFRSVRHRWLDRTLFGRDNGLDAEPRVLVQDSQGTWHESDQWPLEPSQRVTLASSGDGALVDSAAGMAAAGAPSYADTPGVMRGTWTDAHVAFRSEPLPEPRLINGAPRVRLVASSTAAETKWVAYLLDEAPDGRWQRISHGYADSHQWSGESQWLPMIPGTEYVWEIALQPTAVVVEAGHRVTLLISSQDSRNVEHSLAAYCFADHRGGCYSPSGILPAASIGRAVNTIVSGAEGTAVTLDWVDPALTAKPPW